MKTTVEISEALLEETRRTAVREKTTVRALIEEGLRKVVTERAARRKAFKLKLVTAKGGGLVQGVSPTLPRHLAYDLPAVDEG
jgi:hypothetical protein